MVMSLRRVRQRRCERPVTTRDRIRSVMIIALSALITLGANPVILPSEIRHTGSFWSGSDAPMTSPSQKPKLKKLKLSPAEFRHFHWISRGDRGVDCYRSFLLYTNT